MYVFEFLSKVEDIWSRGSNRSTSLLFLFRCNIPAYIKQSIYLSVPFFWFFFISFVAICVFIFISLINNYFYIDVSIYIFELQSNMTHFVRKYKILLNVGTYNTYLFNSTLVQSLSLVVRWGGHLPVLYIFYIGTENCNFLANKNSNISTYLRSFS